MPRGKAIKGSTAGGQADFGNEAISGFGTSVQGVSVVEGLNISGCGPPCTIGIDGGILPDMHYIELRVADIQPILLTAAETAAGDDASTK